VRFWREGPEAPRREVTAQRLLRGPRGSPCAFDPTIWPRFPRAVPKQRATSATTSAFCFATRSPARPYVRVDLQPAKRAGSRWIRSRAAMIVNNDSATQARRVPLRRPMESRANARARDCGELGRTWDPSSTSLPNSPQSLPASTSSITERNMPGQARCPAALVETLVVGPQPLRLLRRPAASIFFFPAGYGSVETTDADALLWRMEVAPSTSEAKSPAASGNSVPRTSRGKRGIDDRSAGAGSRIRARRPATQGRLVPGNRDPRFLAREGRSGRQLLPDKAGGQPHGLGPDPDGRTGRPRRLGRNQYGPPPTNRDATTTMIIPQNLDATRETTSRGACDYLGAAGTLALRGKAKWRIDAWNKPIGEPSFFSLDDRFYVWPKKGRRIPTPLRPQGSQCPLIRQLRRDIARTLIAWRV